MGLDPKDVITSDITRARAELFDALRELESMTSAGAVAYTKTTSIYLNATIIELEDSMKRFGTGVSRCTTLHNRLNRTFRLLCKKSQASPRKSW